MAARIELDLRIGAAFTRLQTLQLQTVVAALKEKVISYGLLHLDYVPHFCGCKLTGRRIMSVSYVGIRC